jgi:hypothetical protein
MNSNDSWPQTLRVRLDTKEMLRFAHQEAFRDDDFPLTMTRRFINLYTNANFFLPELHHLEQAGEGWLLQSPGDLPKYLRVFGLDVPLPETLLEIERLWELKFSKYGGWDVFSINDQVLAVLGGDDLPPGPLPPGGMPLGVSFCMRYSLTSLPMSTRITELLIQCAGSLPCKDAQKLIKQSQLRALQISTSKDSDLPDCLPFSLQRLYLCSFRGNLAPDCLQKLSDLQELQLSKYAFASLYQGASNLLRLPPNLRRLRFITCEVDNLNFLQGLKQLQDLEIKGLLGVDSLEAISDLAQLENLSLLGFPRVGDLTYLRNLKKLRWLWLGGMNHLTDLEPLQGLEELRNLILIECDALEDLAPLAKLANLECLNLVQCNGIKDLSPIEGNPNLSIII